MGVAGRAVTVVGRAWRRIRERRRGTPRTRLLTLLICLLAGVMITVSAINARGTDLRPDRNTDLVDLLRSESARNSSLARQVAQARAEVDELSRTSAADPAEQARLEAAASAAGLVAVEGAGMTVTLDDAPASVQPPGVDADLLVVHQQDIQAVVNVLWRSGAQAVVIQGQRVISTTGIKCVGNTVVLQGVPYAPPYVISAVGDQAALQQGLADSSYLQKYRQYVDAYRLGYDERREANLVAPGFQGSTQLTWAHEPSR